MHELGPKDTERPAEPGQHGEKGDHTDGGPERPAAST